MRDGIEKAGKLKKKVENCKKGAKFKNGRKLKSCKIENIQNDKKKYLKKRGEFEIVKEKVFNNKLFETARNLNLQFGKKLKAGQKL